MSALIAGILISMAAVSEFGLHGLDSGWPMHSPPWKVSWRAVEAAWPEDSDAFDAFEHAVLEHVFVLREAIGRDIWFSRQRKRENGSALTEGWARAFYTQDGAVGILTWPWAFERPADGDDPNRSIVTCHSGEQRYEILRRRPDGRADTFVALYKHGTRWRAIEVHYYPNGTPHMVLSYENGQPVAMNRVYDLAGGVAEEVIAGVPQLDPRVHPGIPMDMPPQGLPSAGDGTPAVCAVYVAYAEPVQDAPPDTPWYSLTYGNAGQTVQLAAPEIRGHRFVEWRGDASDGMIRLGESKRVIAVYENTTGVPDAGLRQALIAALGKAPEDCSLAERAALTGLSARDLQIAELDGLNNFPNLAHLDLQGNLLSGIAAISPLSDFVTPLVKPLVKSDTDAPELLYALAGSMRRLLHLQTLNISGTQIRGLDNMDAFPELEKLEARDLALTDLQPLTGLAALRELDLQGNDIEAIGVLTTLPALERVNLDNNRVVKLKALAESESFSNVALSLAGNPAGESPAPDAAALRGRGVELHLEEMAERADLAGDTDGDGYPNREEWTFTGLFHAQEQAHRDAFAAAILDPAVPSDYLRRLPDSVKKPGVAPDRVASIPTESVGIHLQGEGTVYPGDGNHGFAMYRLHDDGTWSFNTLTFEIKPAEGWVIQSVQQPMGDDTPVDTVTVDLEEIYPIMATFVYVGNYDQLDLVGDFTAFVDAHFSGEDVLAFDRNETQYITADETEYVANGIPDSAEIALLEYTLQSPTRNRDWNGGIYYTELSAAWEHNLIQARKDLRDHAGDPGALHTLTAYMTMGDYDTQRWAQYAFSEAFGIELGTRDYDNSCSRYFGPDDEPDNNGSRNEDVWEDYAEQPRTRALLKEYARSALTEDDE